MAAIAQGMVTNNGTHMQVGPVFNPASLFASSEKGVWYQPDDFTTLFTDTAGTTPVTAVEQPVGLMLDKSQGLVLGSEVLPALSTYSVVLTGTWAASGSDWVFTDTVGSQIRPGVNSGVTLTSGVWFKVQIEIASITGASEVRINGAGASAQLLGAGAHTFYVLGTGTDVVRIRLEDASTSVNDGFSISSFSIKAIPGNHAVAANGSTARPVLRNRYNSLLFSEQFDQGYWSKAADSAVSSNVANAPDGTTTADKLYSTADNPGRVRTQVTGLALTGNYVFSCYLKKSELNWARLSLAVSGAYDGAFFDLENGVLGSASSGYTATISSAGDGWYRCSVQANVSNADAVRIVLAESNGDDDLPPGSLNSGIYIWGAQLTTAADHDAINGEYQRIAAAPTVGAAPTYDDNPSKFPVYLYATTDDAMSTASIDFSGGDEMSVFAGVTKESDATTGMMVELSNTASIGSFRMAAPFGFGVANFYFQSGGTALSAATGTTFAAPATAVLTGLGAISTDQSLLRVNGAQAASNTGDQGTGNYGNYPLYLFSRNNSQSFVNGRLYSLIVRNALPTADELSGAETYVNSKTRAY